MDTCTMRMNCYNKSTFKSLKHAKNVARHFARNLYAYYCYDCRGWHLTHRKKFFVKYNIKANNYDTPSIQGGGKTTQ